MRLKYQLFITLLISSGILIATLYAFNSWSFNRGFLNYINNSEIQALQPLQATLSESYAETGSWDWLAQNRSLWPKLVNDLNRDTRRNPRDRAQGQSRPADDADRGRSNESDGPKHRPPPSGRNPRIVLADENQQIIFGRLEPNRPVQWLPITIDTSVVGYLGYKPSAKLPGQLDNVFADQQKRSFAIVSLLMVALSALLAAILSSRIVRPVLKVSDAVSEISHGKYDHRVDASRQDELGDLSRDINQLAYTLEHSRTARREWIAELSHELRTPVAILQSEIEAIEDGIRTLDLQAINSLHAETLRLSHLINDLHDLSLSDIGALEYKMAPLNLLALVDERTIAVGSLRVEKKIALQVNATSSNFPINGDRHRLGQLLDNLLQNSLRYTDEGGQIQIDLSQDTEGVYLVWQDSTPGLTNEQLPLLFEPLFRAEESRNRTQGGSGLGLTIAQKIVLAHQGSIEVTHSPLGGLAVTIQFPNKSFASSDSPNRTAS